MSQATASRCPSVASDLRDGLIRGQEWLDVLAGVNGYLPQPNQLGPNGQSEEAWWNKFHEFWTDERMQLALNRMPPMAQYAATNRRGLPAQAQFVKDLLEIGAETVSGLSAFIEKNVIRLSYLTLEDCSRLGATRVREAYDRGRDGLNQGWLERERFPKIQSHDLLQSCYGVPGIETTNSMMCDSCPWKASCQNVRTHVLKRVKSSTGDVDPIAARRRALQRERTRKSRALKKMREAS